MEEMLQSAYKVRHSTETASVKVQNDILCAFGNCKSIILLLLRLSAAFDTVNHSLFLSRLRGRYGIKGKAHEWLRSYLSKLMQFVQIENSNLSKRPLVRGIPQGSLLGPLLYALYTLPYVLYTLVSIEMK